MDNLINTTEEYKKEREMWIAVSTLIVVVIIAASILIRNVKIKNLFFPCFCAIISIFLGLLIYFYNRELDNTTVLYYEIEQEHKSESKPLTLLTVFYVLIFIFIVLFLISLLILFLMYKPSEVVPEPTNS